MALEHAGRQSPLPILAKGASAFLSDSGASYAMSSGLWTTGPEPVASTLSSRLTDASVSNVRSASFMFASSSSTRPASAGNAAFTFSASATRYRSMVMSAETNSIVDGVATAYFPCQMRKRKPSVWRNWRLFKPSVVEATREAWGVTV